MWQACVHASMRLIWHECPDAACPCERLHQYNAFVHEGIHATCLYERLHELFEFDSSWLACVAIGSANHIEKT